MSQKILHEELGNNVIFKGIFSITIDDITITWQGKSNIEIPKTITTLGTEAIIKTINERIENITAQIDDFYQDDESFGFQIELRQNMIKVETFYSDELEIEVVESVRVLMENNKAEGVFDCSLQVTEILDILEV